MAHLSFAELLTEARRSPAYHREKIVQRFLRTAERTMDAHGISRADLARRMEVKPPYVTRLFGGGTNLSLDTVAKIAAALDMEVHLHLAPVGQDTRWVEAPRRVRTGCRGDLIRGNFRPLVKREQRQGESDATISAAA